MGHVSRNCLYSCSYRIYFGFAIDGFSRSRRYIAWFAVVDLGDSDVANRATEWVVKLPLEGVLTLLLVIGQQVIFCDSRI